MELNVIDLSAEYGLPGHARLHCYLHDVSPEVARYNGALPAMIVFPGGGYGFVSEREGDPVAVDFYNRHYNTFVLIYDIAPAFHYPTQLYQASAAVDYVRTHAADLKVDPKRVYVCGFSAGGHLAAHLSNCYAEVPASVTGGRQPDNRPDGTVLCYPVITPTSHMGSFQNLLGEAQPDPSRLDALDLEKSVTAHNPPTYIWTTAADHCVDPSATLLYALQLHRHGVPFACHVYPYGEHGLSVGDQRVNDGPLPKVPVTGWLDEADAFLKSL